MGRKRTLSRGGYGFFDSGDGQRGKGGDGGVWTPSMADAHAAQVRAAQEAAAEQAEAEMQARRSTRSSRTRTLSTHDKIRTLRRLTPSGYSTREWTMIQQAEAAL
jgi:hypothetical protein